jgi:hypothetical protein
VGLFSSLNSIPAGNPHGWMPFTSIIKNVHLVNVTVTGSTIVGGIVGEMSEGSIVENSSVNGTIFGYATVGGIAGLVRNNSIIRTSFTGGTITGNAVGGIAGTLNSSTIRDSYSSATTIGGYNGGLVGMTMNSSIINSYTIGNNNDFGTGFGGRIAGYALRITDSANPHLNNISNNFWEINPQFGSNGFGFITDNHTGGAGKTTVEMKQATTFINAGWNFETIWDICHEYNNGYPYLRFSRTGIRITPAEHDFGNVTVGQTVQQTFTIENLGSNSVTVNNITMSGTNQNEFGLLGVTGLPWNIDAGETMSFEASFSPISVGVKTARFTITHSEDGSPRNVAINGTGILGPIFSISPTSHDFGYIAVNNTSPNQTFTITNTGSNIINISSITLEGANNEEFNLAVFDLPWAISTNGRSFAVAFAPKTSGTKTANLRIVHDASETPHIVELSGGATSESDSVEIPTVTTLLGNYPNPFNPETTIKFGLNKDEHVMIEIYNIRGQRINTLINDQMRAGYHQVVWNGRCEIGNQVGSGIYFYRLKAGEYQSVRRMLQMK